MLSKLSSAQKGILFALIGYTSFALADTNAKWLTSDFSVFQVITFSYAFASLALLALNKYLGGWRGWNDKKELRIHLLRIVFNFVAVLIVVYSLSIMPMADFYAMVFAKPFIAVPLAILFYSERVSRHRWIAIIFGFIGILIVLRPGFDANLALLIPFSGAFLIAVIFLISRSLTSASPFLLGFYPLFSASLLALPFTIFYYVEPNLTHIAHFMIGGLLGASGMVFVSLAFREADASIVTVFLYTEMIWGLLADTFIFGKLPDIWTFIGAAVIIGSGLYVIRTQKKEKPPTSALPESG